MEYIDDIMSTDETGNYTGYIKKIIPETYNTNVWYNSWVHCWDVVWGGTFLKLNALFPENELFRFIARWNVEFLSGGAAKHEDPSDVNYVITSPAGYTMLNGWGSARYNAAIQLSALVYMKTILKEQILVSGQGTDGIPDGKKPYGIFIYSWLWI